VPADPVMTRGRRGWPNSISASQSLDGEVDVLPFEESGFELLLLSAELVEDSVEVELDSDVEVEAVDDDFDSPSEGRASFR